MLFNSKIVKILIIGIIIIGSFTVGYNIQSMSEYNRLSNEKKEIVLNNNKANNILKEKNVILDNNKIDDISKEKNIQQKLKPQEIIKLIEKIDPYSLKCPLTPKERYEIRQTISDFMGSDEYNTFVDNLNSCKFSLQQTVVDKRYLDLINTEHKRWEAYDENHYFGVSDVLSCWENRTGNQLLDEDLEMVVNLVNYALKHHDVLAIIDANRILQDINRHLISTPYCPPGSAKVDHGNYHDIYFGATKTLEGKHSLISNLNSVKN